MLYAPQTCHHPFHYLDQATVSCNSYTAVGQSNKTEKPGDLVALRCTTSLHFPLHVSYHTTEKENHTWFSDPCTLTNLTLCHLPSWNFPKSSRVWALVTITSGIVGPVYVGLLVVDCQTPMARPPWFCPHSSKCPHISESVERSKTAALPTHSPFRAKTKITAMKSIHTYLQRNQRDRSCQLRDLVCSTETSKSPTVNVLW